MFEETIDSSTPNFRILTRKRENADLLVDAMHPAGSLRGRHLTLLPPDRVQAREKRTESLSNPASTAPHFPEPQTVLFLKPQTVLFLKSQTRDSLSPPLPHLVRCRMTAHNSRQLLSTSPSPFPPPSPTIAAGRRSASATHRASMGYTLSLPPTSVRYAMACGQQGGEEAASRSTASVRAGARAANPSRDCRPAPPPRPYNLKL